MCQDIVVMVYVLEIHLVINTKNSLKKDFFLMSKISYYRAFGKFRKA